MSTPSPSSHSAQQTIKVWDPVVRVGHWVLVVCFAIAYLTEGEPEWLHVWSGYAIAAVVVIRVIWGVVGTRYARFTDFVTGPRKALGYLRQLLTGRAHRHIGHSPAGGLMVLALLFMLALTTLLGMAHLAEQKGTGPLAGYVAQVERSSDGHRHGIYGDVHALAANLTLFLIVLHLGGVAAASLAHRENLVRAMVNGRKRP